MVRVKSNSLVRLIEVQVKAPRSDRLCPSNEVAHRVARKPHDGVLMHCICEVLAVADDVKAPSEAQQLVEKAQGGTPVSVRSNCWFDPPTTRKSYTAPRELLRVN